MTYICDDILFCIFEYLDLSDTINVSLVCTHFDAILNDHILWRTYYERDYNLKHDILNALSTRENIKNVRISMH